MRAWNGESRQSWDEYFLTVAEATASRSTSAGRPVGAVLVRERHIRATGYNGPPAGYRGPGSLPTDDADAIERVTVHAEVNAVLFAAPEHREGATLYTTAMPMFSTARVIANSGVKEVVVGSGRYEGWEETRAFLLDCGVRVRMLDGLEHAVPLPLVG